jgi:alkylation response protein AidB-like acyl-CoA dehydrogenase
MPLCRVRADRTGLGSDAGSISTTYREVGDEYVLNGSKIFITNGSVADWIVVFATKDKALKHGAFRASSSTRTRRA